MRSVSDRGQIRAHPLHFAVDCVAAKDASRQRRRLEPFHRECVRAGQPSNADADPEHGRSA